MSRLIAWAKRDEWRGALAALLDRHRAKARVGTGIAPPAGIGCGMDVARMRRRNAPLRFVPTRAEGG
jgi:hypothetical protein